MSGCWKQGCTGLLVFVGSALRAGDGLRGFFWKKYFEEWFYLCFSNCMKLLLAACNIGMYLKKILFEVVKLLVMDVSFNNVIKNIIVLNNGTHALVCLKGVGGSWSQPQPQPQPSPATVTTSTMPILLGLKSILSKK